MTVAHSKINAIHSRVLAELAFAQALLEDGTVSKFDYEEFIIDVVAAFRNELKELFPNESV